MTHYLLYFLTVFFIYDQSVVSQNVTIVTDPAGIPVDGQPGIFDYPILTSVTLMCMATAVDGSPVTVTSYRWTASNCYTRADGVLDPCFYNDNPTGQNITGTDLQAVDAGTITCTVTIDGMDYTSDAVTLRISGVKLTGGTEGTIAGGMGDGSNFPSSSNVLDDYTYILIDGSESNDAILFRCVTGLGPSSGDNDDIGDMYYNNMLLTNQMCSGFVIPQGQNDFRFPGTYQARTCGAFTTSTEGVYTCTLTNSSMMSQNVSIGIYFSGRIAPEITAMSSPSSLSAVDIVLGSNITLTCTSSGSPPDTFTWMIMKDGVLVTQSTDITTMTYTSTTAVFSSSYTISNVSISDNGTYTCTVTNPIGTDNNSFTINIRPDTPPVNCAAAAISSTAVMITWSPPVIANGIITDYNVSYVPGQSLSTADYSADGNVNVAIGNNDTTYDVSNLRIATNYYVAIAAHTMVGIGPYSSDNCTVQTMEDVPGSPPLNVILTSPTSTSININWDLPDPLSRNGIITKHQLNYTEASQPLNWTTVPLNASTSYLIEGLKIFTQYYVSVSAGTQITGFGPFSDPKIIRTVIPTPLNVMITSVNESSISLSWDKPSMLDEIIMYYQVSYMSDLTSQQFINITNTNITLTNLSSGVQYSIVVTAITETGERIDSDTVTGHTLNIAFFQIRLRPITNCEGWTVDDEEQKQNDIKAEIILQVVMRCSCEFTSSNIIDDTFSCRGSQGEFRNTVVYRAMITLQVAASVTDADNIVTVLNEWVESEPSVMVNRVTLDIDSSCPIMLDSFDSNDCEASSDGTSQTSSPSVGIIVGAAVAAVVVMLLLITAVVIITMYRRHKSSYSVTKQHQHVHDYVTTKPLTSGGRGRPIEKSASNDNDIVMDVNPAYGEGIRFADKTIKADNDAEYEIVDTQSRQRKTADIKLVKNPAYAETTFT